MSEIFCIELFPCSGGMAEGFRRAGITFDMAFDKDADACASYEANHGHRPVQMDVRDLLRMVRAGWSPGRAISLLVADPPCTPWSRAGKRRGVADERDMLVETCDLIALLRPRAYLIGNVPGLNDAPQWGHVQEHIGGLQRHGYCVRDYAELDAASYGVPQRRIRPFWFGHLEGPCVRWPAPTHGDPSVPLALPGCALRPWVTCREALGHLPPGELGRPVRMRLRAAGEDKPRTGSDVSRCSVTDQPAAVVGCHDTGKGGQILVANPKHPPSRVDEPALTIPSSQPCNGGAVLALREPNPNLPPASPDAPHRAVTGAREQALLEWPWERPATTVYDDERLMPPGHHDGSNLSQPNAVVLSEKAAAILQGFPPGWKFLGKTKSSRWSMLGQAMPPGLAEPVARAIAEQMRRTRGVAA